MKHLPNRSRRGNAAVLFLVVLAAIIVGVFMFSPDKLPSGVGLKPLPMTCTTRPSFLALGTASVAILTNDTAETLHNVKLVCKSRQETKELFKEAWAPKESYEVGPFQAFAFVKGDSIEVYASGYLPRVWGF